ncbi:MAG: LytTR family transcriptional regulator DNA-binding domain-containing protein [Salibacteraceae bacterium]
MRIHNSYYINLDFVVSYIKGDGGEVVMQNDAHLSVSRSKKEPLLTQLKLKN